MSTDNSILITTNMISVDGAARLRRSDDYRDVVLDVATDGDTIKVVNNRLQVNSEVGLYDTISFGYKDLERYERQDNGIPYIRYKFRFNTLRMFELLEQTPEGPIVVQPQKVMRSIDGNYTEIFWDFSVQEDRHNRKFRETKWYILFGKTGEVQLPDNPDNPPTPPDEPDEPVVSNIVYYGYILDGVTYRVSDVTADMILANSRTTTVATTDGIALSVLTGSVYYIAVPVGHSAFKDDGTGNQIPFDENMGIEGTGANGIELTINKASYKLYGEFSMIDCNNTLYVVKD